MSRACLVSFLSAIAAIALAACGSSASPEDEVRTAAVRSIETDKSKVFCRQLVSDRFLEELTGGGARACEKTTVVSKDPGKAVVSAVAIKGKDESRAEVAVAVRGGEADGTSGHLEMVRDDDRWLLDRYEDDFLRSNFLVAIRKTDVGAFSNRRLKSCVGKQVKELSGDRVREIIRDVVSSDPAAMIRDLLPLAENCELALAEYGADEFTEGLVEGGQSPAYVNCLHDEIEGLLLLTGITPELLHEHPGFAPVAALEGIAAGAKRNCMDKKRSG